MTESNENQPIDESDQIIADELDLVSFDEQIPPDHRSGFIAIMGRPNVGKSTLMNSILGQKVAIVSSKPQTTRLRQLGILTMPKYQVIFIDTPGWHEPRDPLGDYMVSAAARALEEADLVLFLVDGSSPPNDLDQALAQELRKIKSPVLLALNKMDVGIRDAIANQKAYSDLLEDPICQWISALQGTNLEVLVEHIVEQLPVGPRYYPVDQVTDIQLRQLVAELIREQVLRQTRHEVPHAVAVIVNEFKERESQSTYISATIFVERESQKGIIIGSGGRKLKNIGVRARNSIEESLEQPVFLDLWVKVRDKWRKKEDAVRKMGYRKTR
ncbi:MAG: GTPase Era [Chloroflexota bacterium]